jgi:hypothetical protein
MFPKIHAIYGFLFSMVLFLLFPQITLLHATIIFLSSVLIDVDHYLYYVYREKNWNLKRSFKWYLKNELLFNNMSEKQKAEIYTGLCFLHGIEAILILFILGVFIKQISGLVFPVLLGFLFHQFLDLIDLFKRHYRLDKVISFFYAIKNSKNKRLLQDLKNE